MFSLDFSPPQWDKMARRLFPGAGTCAPSDCKTAKCESECYIWVFKINFFLLLQNSGRAQTQIKYYVILEDTKFS